MWNEEGGDGEHRVVPSEPDLVGSIPGQGVQVVHEHRLLQVLPHQLVKLMECLHISRTNKASARHFKAVEGGLVRSDVSQKVRVFVCFFCVPCFDVAYAGHCKFVNVQCFVCSSTITISGFKFVTQISGGIVPPPGASKPSLA